MEEKWSISCYKCFAAGLNFTLTRLCHNHSAVRNDQLTTLCFRKCFQAENQVHGYLSIRHQHLVLYTNCNIPCCIFRPKTYYLSLVKLVNAQKFVTKKSFLVKLTKYKMERNQHFKLCLTKKEVCREKSRFQRNRSKSSINHL